MRNFYNLYSLPNLIKIIKISVDKIGGYVARTGEIPIVYIILVVKIERN
jgi:hypothetical protein